MAKAAGALNRPPREAADDRFLFPAIHRSLESFQTVTEPVWNSFKMAVLPLHPAAQRLNR
jgi:hypothetical protein